MTLSRSEAASRASQCRSHESRVEGGKKAASTRGYESLAAAGRKGGQVSAAVRSSRRRNRNG